jgi:oligopeptide/dipeptide ABC transporter ATP-binding protein
MWHGRIVEEAATETIFATPHHPYTRSLLDAIPAAHPRLRRPRTFQTRAEIEAQIARQPGTPQGQRLIAIAPGHRAEVILT